MVKCDYCKDRLDAGLQPACVTKCVTGCLSFGVANEVPDPIHLAWRQFLRGRGPSVLVIDATDFDAHARGSAAVLDGAPWLLAEGVLIAAGLRDSRKVELRLPAELTGREAAVLNTADAIRLFTQVSAPRIQVDVHPADEGQGGRALPRRGRLGELAAKTSPR